jgi:hypothetical protein
VAAAYLIGGGCSDDRFDEHPAVPLQFHITLAALPHLDGKHVVFSEAASAHCGPAPVLHPG